MKVRAKSMVKLTNGRVNLDYTFVAGTELELLAEQLLTQFAFQNGKEAVIALANRVSAKRPTD